MAASVRPVVALLCLLAACGSAPPKADPALLYGERVRARVAATSSQLSFKLRHNPAPCDCPPYEVELQGGWHRVAFTPADPDDPVVLALEQARERDPAGVFEIQGSLDDALSTCGRGTVVVALALDAFGPPLEPPPEGEGELDEGDRPDDG